MRKVFKFLTIDQEEMQFYQILVRITLDGN